MCIERTECIVRLSRESVAERPYGDLSLYLYSRRYIKYIVKIPNKRYLNLYY